MRSFRCLKGIFDMEDMEENFAHFSFVNPYCSVFELHYRVSYKSLKYFVDIHTRKDNGKQ